MNEELVMDVARRLLETGKIKWSLEMVADAVRRAVDTSDPVVSLEWEWLEGRSVGYRHVRDEIIPLLRGECRRMLETLRAERLLERQERQREIDKANEERGGSSLVSGVCLELNDKETDYWDEKDLPHDWREREKRYRRVKRRIAGFAANEEDVWQRRLKRRAEEQ